MDSGYRIIEKANRDKHDIRFNLARDLEAKASAYAAAIFGTAQLVEESFGETNYVVVDYAHVKLMLIKLLNWRHFMGLIVNRSTNVDYITRKINAKIGIEQADDQYI